MCWQTQDIGPISPNTEQQTHSKGVKTRNSHDEQHGNIHFVNFLMSPIGTSSHSNMSINGSLLLLLLIFRPPPSTSCACSYLFRIHKMLLTQNIKYSCQLRQLTPTATYAIRSNYRLIKRRVTENNNNSIRVPIHLFVSIDTPKMENNKPN